jgi:hypothetical protein
VTVTSSTISGNSAGRWGGILANGDVTVAGSTILGNSSDYGGSGGGISALGNATVTSSTISGNLAGGLYARGNVTVTNSTISGNSAGIGGGLYAHGNVTVNNTTISGNSTSYYGGGIRVSGNVTVTNSTISGNSAAQGGAIWAYGGVTLAQSTVTNNQATHASSTGGGIHQYNAPSNSALSISGSILVGNTAGGGAADLVADLQSTLTVNYSLIGTGITPIAGGNNIVTNVPLLGPLAENGGPTLTHALLPGSPALDAGNPNFMPPPEFDQRGEGFARVADAGSRLRIDIGAYESQGVPTFAPGDYNRNGIVDSADYVVWRKMLGEMMVEPFSGADGNGNGVIDQADHQVWQSNFGATLRVATPPMAAAWMEPVAEQAGAVGGAVSSPLAPIREFAPTTLKASSESPLAIEAWFALFGLELQSRDAATGESGRVAAVQKYRSRSADLLLVVDAVFSDKDNLRLATVALDAAFSPEDDEASATDPLAMTFGDSVATPSSSIYRR